METNTSSHESEDVVYHGSQIQNLKVVVPEEAGYKNRYVYASSEIALAAIFINRKPGGSWVATWGFGKNGPFFCERVKGIFDKWYAGQKGSIYVLSKDDFHHEGYMSSHEWVSEKPVKVVKEIQINDVKQFLLDLEKQGKIKITYYDDRPERYRSDDDMIEMAIKMIEKYGLKQQIERIREFQPQIENRVMEELKKRKIIIH